MIILITFSMLTAFPVESVVAEEPPNPVRYWALIVCGTNGSAQTFKRDATYMYHVLSDHYEFDGIYYLSYWTDMLGVNASAHKENLIWAITTWLNQSSDYNDVIFIYFTTHGGGHNIKKKGPQYPLNQVVSGRYDIDGDEGNETRESTIGYDIDGDGNVTDKWVGIDECLYLEGSEQNPYYPFKEYYDDEFAANLTSVEYGKLVIAILACYGGGFIDDLSGPNRIIMTAANETYTGWSIGDDGFSPWSEALIDALHGKDTYWNYEKQVLAHGNETIDADFNEDGHVDMNETWCYAWENDVARLNGNETNWLDDDGNQRPTYLNETDQLDDNDGYNASLVWFPKALMGDINHDGEVDVYDKVIIGAAFGASYNASDGMYWHQPPDFVRPCIYCPHDPRADLNDDLVIDVYDKVIVGIHFGEKREEGSHGSSQRLMRGGSPEVSVDPNEITVNKYGVFSVNTTISDVTDLYGWEFKLYWDNTILNCTGAQVYAPDVWGENSSEDGLGIQNDFNATHGRYWKALSGLHPATPFNGSMAVVSLTFEAKTVGTSTLDLQDTKLANIHAEAISHTASDGSVNILSQRYMRGDQHTVNNLNAYKLAVPQSAIHKTVLDGTAGRKTIYWGIRVWKRGSAGNETEITGGTPVAQVSRSRNGEGMQSNTWSCPQTSLQSTDAIIVRVYMKFGSGEWQLCSTFITEQLQASQLDSVQWTVYYYTWCFYDRWEGITSGSYDWGTTTCNSRIQNFQYT